MSKPAFASADGLARHAEDTLTRPRKDQRCPRWSQLPYRRPCRGVYQHYHYYRGTQGLPAAQGWIALLEDESLGVEKRQPGLCCMATWKGGEYCQEGFHKQIDVDVEGTGQNASCPVDTCAPRAPVRSTEAAHSTHTDGHIAALLGI